jgi:hypothetical protein
MAKRLMAGLIGAVFVSLVMTLSGCARPKTTRYVATVSIKGHEVKADVDSPASTSNEGDNAVVSFGGHRLVVERERIVLDGKEQAKLPAGASKIELEYTAGKLRATADGAPLEIAGQPK